MAVLAIPRILSSNPEEDDRPGAAQRWGLLVLVLAILAAGVITVDKLMGWLLGR